MIGQTSRSGHLADDSPAIHLPDGDLSLAV